MDRPSKTNREEYYDKLSASYDELYGAEQLRKHYKIADLLGNETFEIVVDVGCGTGNLLEKVADRYGFAVGIDISMKMLRKARARLERERVELVRADSKALPTRSASVKCVLSISMLDSKDEDYIEQISEVRRIVEQSGTLAFTIFHPDDQVVRLEQFGLPSGTSVENLSRIEALYVVQGDSTAHNRPGGVGNSQLL